LFRSHLPPVFIVNNGFDAAFELFNHVFLPHRFRFIDLCLRCWIASGKWQQIRCNVWHQRTHELHQSFSIPVWKRFRVDLEGFDFQQTKQLIGNPVLQLNSHFSSVKFSFYYKVFLLGNLPSEFYFAIFRLHPVLQTVHLLCRLRLNIYHQHFMFDLHQPETAQSNCRCRCRQEDKLKLRKKISVCDEFPESPLEDAPILDVSRLYLMGDSYIICYFWCSYNN
jgi:hypothetical protein